MELRISAKSALIPHLKRHSAAFAPQKGSLAVKSSARVYCLGRIFRIELMHSENALALPYLAPHAAFIYENTTPAN
jgi:hypothetical protein